MRARDWEFWLGSLAVVVVSNFLGGDVDPLTLIAGIMREPFWRFMLLVTVAKAGRYLVLVLLTLGWVHS